MYNNRNNRETVIIPQTIIVPTISIIVASLVLYVTLLFSVAGGIFAAIANNTSDLSFMPKIIRILRSCNCIKT